MATTDLKLYVYDYREGNTYLAASLLALGNLVLPQLFHMLPQGGITWLPIYFFTLIGAYKYGWRVGLLIALLSPLLNSTLFGMPPAAALPGILIKSVLLAGVAGLAAQRFGRISIPILIGVVLFYQLIGSLAEWLLSGNLYAAIQDFRIAVPGMLMQIIGGWVFIRYILRK